MAATRSSRSFSYSAGSAGFSNPVLVAYVAANGMANALPMRCEPSENGFQKIVVAFSAWAMLMMNTSDEVEEKRFTELEAAAMHPDQRQFYDGKRVSVVGRYSGNERELRLTRYRINCCAADAQPINVLFIVAPTSKETLPVKQLENKWVRVIGQIRFVERSPGNFGTALLIVPNERESLSDLVKVVDPPANPYVD